MEVGESEWSDIAERLSDRVRAKHVRRFVGHMCRAVVEMWRVAEAACRGVERGNRTGTTTSVNSCELLFCNYFHEEHR